MVLPLLVVLAFVGVAVHNVPPSLATIMDVAAYTRCQPDRIAFYLSTVEYKVEPTWPTSEGVLERRKADCKGHAVLARDVLAECGYEARIVKAKGYKAASTHTWALYQKPNGRRGYVNFHLQDEFAPGTPWDEVVQAVPGGPWRVTE